MRDFAQRATQLGALRGILASYPYSVGLFREILQNADDAHASKQIFVLDRRTHSTASLLHSNLSSTQGPALLAYNDAKFSEEDWNALQTINESSKTEDVSKIGKYGVGFRSLFHITDCPQIVSGNTFALFDPLQAFTDSTGKRVDLRHTMVNSPDQLTSFRGLPVPFPSNPNEFNGTVIRCPLRSKSSGISSKLVHPVDIARLFDDFVSKEVGICLLFLRHIEHIEIHDINELGEITIVANLTISRSLPILFEDDNAETYTATVKLRAKDQETETSWRILHSRSDAIGFNQFHGKNGISETLKIHKLLPDIGIAVPFSITTEKITSGRLFTFLPLPLPTKFPVHIHAYFALSQSRQNLRNSREIGLVPGTDDHTLVKWNEHLFSTYIPRTWGKLLEILVDKHSDIEDIFNAWPPKQPPASSGESLYWESLPMDLIKCTTTARSPIWPVYRPNTSTPRGTDFRPLGDLLVADPTAPPRVLDALTTVGLRLTRPPQYIFDLIKQSNVEGSAILTPKAAHEHLLNHLEELFQASKDTADIICEYLLSSNDVMNVVGLPLFRLVNDTVVALSPPNQDEPIYVLFDRKAFDVFGACDDHAIRLDLLPKVVAAAISDYGPQKLNVAALTVPKIVHYLAIYPTKLGLDVSSSTTDPLALKWLSAFWIWQKTFALKDELYPKIRDFYLLPSSRGLRKADSPLFRSRGAHPMSVQHLSSLGIPFLDDKLSDPAQSVLAAYELLKSITDIHAILDSLPATFNPSLTLSRDACTVILMHLSNSISASRARNSVLGPEHIQRLKSLPIYPLTEFSLSSRRIVVTCRSLPEGNKIKAIGAPSFLPTISGTSFVQFPAQYPLAMSILHHIESPTSKALSDQELLILTVENLLDQPDHILAATLSYMEKENHRRQVPPFVTDMLKQVVFVAVSDGSRRQPKDVVDPFSPIASLYATSPERNARRSTPSDQTIVQALHSLKLMQHSLTIDIIQDRIEYIASNASSSSSLSLSRDLLKIISQTHLDYTKLVISPEQRWLPTSQGLRGSAECRDTAHSSHHLFDEVLAILESFELPISLRKALGWDQPLSTLVLFQQFTKVLEKGGNVFSIVCDLIKQIGLRALSDGELEELKSITQDKKWVPTSDGQLSDSASAIFSKPGPDSGFFQIFHTDGQTMALLRKLGCVHKPSTATIISKLHTLSHEPPSLEVVTSALGLLRSIESDLTDEDRSQLLVPDIHDNLRPFSITFFNDIGDEAAVLAGDDDFISHPLVDEALARKLSLSRLGFKYVGLGIPGVDMGEKPVVTVRRTLTQYTEKQFITEFLANAADANATEFTVLVNEFSFRPTATTSTVRALCPALDKFCEVPSLVVHNNAKFSDKDFTGICRTSIGGKEGRRETIGQFGLGALTMFHFTELAIIISNDHVLFLNPSKAHLPYHDQAACLLPLKLVKKHYSRHLIPVDGLFGFDISKDEPYNGTIFLLPLRTESHYEGSIDSISHVPWTTNQVEINILNALQESAPNCLIFTKLRRISGMTRDTNGIQTAAWKFETEHVGIHTEPDTGYSISDITIRDDSDVSITWKVASTGIENLTMQMPEDLALLTDERHMRSPAAGLAMLFDRSLQKEKTFTFFSTLPLGIPNSLPVHVNASFILSSDRRQIRLDNYGGAETSYNTWLLTEVIPPLYYFLLANSLHHGETDNRHWWPRHRNNDDHHSRLIVDAFYGPKLSNCDRKLFCCVYWQSILLNVREVVLLGDESPSITAALDSLQSRRVAQLSKGVYRLATEHAGISRITPAFLKEEIGQETPQVFTQNVSLKVLQDVIDYLCPNTLGDDPINLVGLRILPLDNGEFGTIVRLEDLGIDIPDDNAGPPPRLYFIWTPKSGKPHNFPAQYFVHHKLSVTKLQRIGINVALLDPSNISMLIEEHLEMYTTFERLPPHICRWIEDFWECWDEYARLGLHPAAISEFPLVPTLNSGVFVSISQCRDGTALIVGGSSEADEANRTCLVNLGLTVVRLDQEPTPDALRSILALPEYPKLSITGVLKGLQILSQYWEESVAQKFDGIDLDMQQAFAAWARRNMHAVPEEFQGIASTIPIWPSVKAGSPEKLRSASEIVLLPAGLPLQSTGRFMDRSVAAHPQLKYLLAPLSLEEMESHLVLPTTMDAEETRDYREFLRAWLPLLPQWYTHPIRVPNHNRVVTPSNELYARDPLFEAAFGTDSEHFVAQELLELQGLLYKHQLRRESPLDVNMFRICAQALSNREDEDDDLVAQAAVLFRAYCLSLPMHVNADERDAWHELDQLSFVPRDLAFERRLDDEGSQLEPAFLSIPLNITSLPDVVPPLNLVRKEFEAVAWTQRALFAEQPHQRVLLAYPELGRPDVSDVIQHLRVLSSMSYSSVGQRQIILHDLKETYAFLNRNILLATEDDRRQLAMHPLFLNVDDPDSDTWHWDDCEHLVFETHDTEGSFRYVRSFLWPYTQLLRAIGALEVYHPSYTSDHSANSAFSKLEAIRKGFDMLRNQTRSLTDVVFIVDDSDDSSDADLPQLAAHRAFLAVASDHFLDAFCGDFAESRPASQDDPVTISVPDHSRKCVQSVLDYIYTGIQSVEDASLDLLLQIMKLSGYWRITDLFEDTQKEIIIRRLITPGTLDFIKEIAEAAQADNLVRACTEYEERNATFIAKVLQSSEFIQVDVQDGSQDETM